MIDHVFDNMPWLAKLNANVRESIYQFAMFGVTQQLQVDMKAVVSMLVVGAVSAFGGAYINSERTAVELKQYAREQAEFRVEMRSYMRDRNAEVLAIYERQARLEATVAINHGNGMNGTSGNGRK